MSNPCLQVLTCILVGSLSTLHHISLLIPSWIVVVDVRICAVHREDAVLYNTCYKVPHYKALMRAFALWLVTTWRTVIAGENMPACLPACHQAEPGALAIITDNWISLAWQHSANIRRFPSMAAQSICMNSTWKWCDCSGYTGPVIDRRLRSRSDVEVVWIAWEEPVMSTRDDHERCRCRRGDIDERTRLVRVASEGKKIAPTAAKPQPVFVRFQSRSLRELSPRWRNRFLTFFCPVEARLHSLFHVPSEPETEGEEGKGGEEAEEGKVQEFRCEVLGMGGRLHQQPSRKVA